MSLFPRHRFDIDSTHLASNLALMSSPAHSTVTGGVEVVGRGRSGCLARWVRLGDLVDASGSCRTAQISARADARSKNAAGGPDWRAPSPHAAHADEARRAAMSIQGGGYLVAS